MPFSCPSFLLTGWNAVMKDGARAGILVHEMTLGTKAIAYELGQPVTSLGKWTRKDCLLRCMGQRGRERMRPH